MTRDEMWALAREHGVEMDNDQNTLGLIQQLESLLNKAAAIGAAHEREACAKVCEEKRKAMQKHGTTSLWDTGYSHAADECAAAIRSKECSPTLKGN